MSNTVETREYVDGETRLMAQVQDNGCVRFTTFAPNSDCGVTSGVSAAVLRELADLADADDGTTIEAAAQDLEQMGRDLRASAVDESASGGGRGSIDLASQAASVADYISGEVAAGRLNPLDAEAVNAAQTAFLGRNP